MGIDYHYTGRMELKGKDEAIVSRVSREINDFSNSNAFRDLEDAPDSYCNWNFEKVNGKMRLYCTCNTFYDSFAWLEYLNEHFIQKNGLYLEGYLFEMLYEENVSLIISSEDELKLIEVDFYDFESEEENEDKIEYLVAKEKIDQHLRDIFRLDADQEILDAYGIYYKMSEYFEDEDSDSYDQKRFRVIKEDGKPFEINDEDSYYAFDEEFDQIADIIVVAEDE